ncbi:MAG: TIGR04282 family arsenosugar biosynthesis glycosyltransferase [Planctomycetota bacterium]
MRTRILLFTRLPRPGRAKTRLIPTLGAAGAAALQRHMTEQLVARLRGHPGLRICYSDGDATSMRRWLGPELDYQPQAEGDLGRRLHLAFADAFAEGATKAIAIGCDIPDLTMLQIEQAEARLQHHDAVLGPATDGGYYLLGLRRPRPDLFCDMPWGGPQVAAITRQRCRASGSSLALLEELRDVDEPADLAWYAPQLLADG